jgi:isochorismate hydrolase
MVRSQPGEAGVRPPIVWIGSNYFMPMLFPEKSAPRNPSLLDASRSLLLIIDAQERFRGAVENMDAVGARIATLAKAATRLGVPAVVTEQYSKALGKTLPEITSSLPADAPVFEKLAFSACDVPEWREAVKESGRDQLILCGVEAHVCILQTALDLVGDADVAVYLAEDAVSSRKASDKAAALRRMEAHGVQIVTVEMIAMEWLRKAGTPVFKEFLGWIK